MPEKNPHEACCRGGLTALDNDILEPCNEALGDDDACDICLDGDGAMVSVMVATDRYRRRPGIAAFRIRRFRDDKTVEFRRMNFDRYGFDESLATAEQAGG
ncbi:MAG: hypothetical protein M9939_08920 [Mesorhizobium sp.]|nr:hypothetical protein [Mesorhizobium sp.]MCO5161244.1 hypothetical protein [Mesorhizobium sp.]